MAARVNHQDLAVGACYALIHAINVLEDGSLLYALKRPSSSFHLTVMAREELGRFLLLAQRHVELAQDETLDAKELAQSLQPHKVKLLAGQSVVPVPMTSERFAAWKTAILQNDEPTLNAISAEVHARAKHDKPHQVADLHQRRLKAQYVDLDPQSGHWSRPSEVAPAEANTLIRTVVGEIANALLAFQGALWLHAAFQSTGQSLPQVGPFTHAIYKHLFDPEA